MWVHQGVPAARRLEETAEQVAAPYRTWILVVEDGHPGRRAWQLQPERGPRRRLPPGTLASGNHSNRRPPPESLNVLGDTKIDCFEHFWQASGREAARLCYPPTAPSGQMQQCPVPRVSLGAARRRMPASMLDAMT